MSQTALPHAFSRRAFCAMGVGVSSVAYLPHVHAVELSGMPQPSSELGTVFDIRGVRPGEMAMLRTAGQIVPWGNPDDQRAWSFTENTQVSWTEAHHQSATERRIGRIQIHPAVGGKIIEISTGPVDELIPSESSGAIATQGQTATLVLSSKVLAPSDVWSLCDDMSASCMNSELTDVRIFRREASEPHQRKMSWSLRSPWLPQLGPSNGATGLLWRGQGTLASWRRGFDLV